jgi:hypothetical protein
MRKTITYWNTARHDMDIRLAAAEADKARARGDEEARHNASRRWKRLIAKREPGRWAKIVESIRRDDVRERVANIVWWDWFAWRDVSDRWPHMDELRDRMGRARSPRRHDVLLALVKIGYPRFLADQRASVEKSVRQKNRTARRK